jgi:hypothetical protein
LSRSNIGPHPPTVPNWLDHLGWHLAGQQKISNNS